MRLLPVIQEAVRRDSDATGYLADCSQCKTMHTRSERQGMGCGFEPADPAFPADPWSPVSLFATWEDEKLACCPGYTTKLPEVLEAARARLHYHKSALGAVLGGDAPTELLVRSIEELEGAYGRVELAARREREAERP